MGYPFRQFRNMKILFRAVCGDQPAKIAKDYGITDKRVYHIIEDAAAKVLPEKENLQYLTAKIILEDYGDEIKDRLSAEINEDSKLCKYVESSVKTVNELLDYVEPKTLRKIARDIKNKKDYEKEEILKSECAAKKQEQCDLFNRN